MSVLEADKIDIVATRADSSEVRLGIADHLTWDDPEHLLLLQEKLNAYIAFVESGQLARLESPKLPANPDVQVVVFLQHEPTAEARAFFERAAVVLRGAGMGLSWQPGSRL